MNNARPHPGYILATRAKPSIPTEIYAYPALARRNAATSGRSLMLPAVFVTPAAKPRMRGLAVIYGAMVLMLWVLAATMPLGRV